MNRRIFKEANLFKDVVILPFVDEPAYTVLKTVAMCSFMVHSFFYSRSKRKERISARLGDFRAPQTPIEKVYGIFLCLPSE